MKTLWFSRMVIGLPIVLLCSQVEAAPRASPLAMCKASVVLTPHKDRGLMCYKKGFTCVCSPADLTDGRWALTEVEPGKPGWNYREINQRFLDDLHNQLLTAARKERGVIGQEIRDVSKLIDRQSGK